MTVSCPIGSGYGHRTGRSMSFVALQNLIILIPKMGVCPIVFIIFIPALSNL